MRRHWILVLALALVIGGSWFAYGIQTDGGQVRVDDVRFAGADGKMLSALLYVPTNATGKTPAPAMLVMHGYINSRETQSGFAIEFARRGYVVLSMDMTGHGYSEPIKGDLSRGALSGLRYLASLPFVDPKNIGTEGHSMGGWSTLTAAGVAPELVKTVVLEGSSSETFGSPKVLADTKFNFAVVFSKYDEFAKLMWGVDKAKDIVNTEKLKKAFGTTDPVIPGRLYGSFENESARKLYIPSSTHPGDHLSREAIGYAVDFVQASMPSPRPLDPANQTWPWKEFGTTVGLVGMVLFMFAFAGLLLDAPYFKGLNQPMPEHPGNGGLSWVIGAAIAAAIPALTFFQFQHKGNVWIKTSAFWPQSLTIGFVVWAVLNGLIALALFFIWHYLWGRKTGGSALQYGLSTDSFKPAFNWGKIGRAGLLAAGTVLGAYMLLSLVNWIFLVDFRFWVVGVKLLTFSRFVIFLKFLLPFLVFFLINGLVLHGQLRLKEYGKNKTMFVWMLANAAIGMLGIAVLVALQLGHLYATELLFFPKESLLGIVAYQFIPLLAITSMVSTYFFRKTGSIYAGAFANAFFVTWYIVAGQAIQFVR